MTDSARCGLFTRRSRSSKGKLLGIAGLVAAGVIAGASGAQAANTGITAVVVQQSGLAFGGCSIGNIGTFTYYQGYVTDSVDPTNPLNTGITDIGLAPKDANGNVSAYANFQIILPTNLANFAGRLIGDWPNRSGAEIGESGEQSTSPTATANCSGTFFYPQGWASAEVGWEQDGAGDPTNGLSPNSFNSKFGVAGVNSTLATGGGVPKMPIATNGANTITGPGYEYIVTTGGFYNLGGGLAYPNYPAASANANSLGGPCTAGSSPQANTVLTWRHHTDDTPFVLPNGDWQFNSGGTAGSNIGNGADGNCDSISLTAAAITDGHATTCTVSPTTCPTGAGFLPNDIYELSYTAAAPTVNGIGHAVNRDFYSWLKGNSGSASQSQNPFSSGGVSTIKAIYMVSTSQPDRTFNDYVHLGFNGDLNGKIVDDGAVNWVGAGSGISMNYRWSHTTETERIRQQHLWAENFFPFSDTTSFDPISGTTDGKYLTCTANNTCPMNLNLFSDDEYWAKSASLYTTDPTGSFDLPQNPLSRAYNLAGSQHGGGTQATRLATGVCQNFNNPIDAEYTIRALFRALDQFQFGYIPVPAQQVGTLAAGTLVTPLALEFPSGYLQTVTGINGGNPFKVLYTGLESTRYRFNFGPNFYSTTTNGRGAPGSPNMIPTFNPPVNAFGTAIPNSPPYDNNPENGPIYPTYVPKVNSDGNPVPGTGIMMPEVQVPLATYFGWNLRSGSPNAPTPQNDGPDGCEGTGGYIQFPTTPAIANANSDPRHAISTLYPTYSTYLNQVVQATDRLIWNRFLLCGPDTSPTSTTTSGTLGSSVIANLIQDWNQLVPSPPSSSAGVSPPSFLPACNDAMTHNFNGGNGGIASMGGATGGNASSVLWRDGSGNVGVWLMNGSTIAQAKILGNVPTSWSIIGQRDFNGDGNADILWRDTSGNVGIWLMNGTSILSTVVVGNMPTTSSVVATGGFNDGGYGHIVWEDNQGNYTVWFMNGTTLVQSSAIGQVPLNWVVAGADPHGDIFWRNIATGEVGMWVMYGTTITKTVDFGVVPLSWSIAGIGDFTGSGSYDILWRDNAGNVGMWLMNGTTITSASVLGNVPLNWTIAQTGDFNGDGTSDILWTDGSGNVGVWFMNGAKISSSQMYGNIGTSWMVQALNSE